MNKKVLCVIFSALVGYTTVAGAEVEENGGGCFRGFLGSIRRNSDAMDANPRSRSGTADSCRRDIVKEERTRDDEWMSAMELAVCEARLVTLEVKKLIEIMNAKTDELQSQVDRMERGKEEQIEIERGRGMKRGGRTQS